MTEPTDSDVESRLRRLEELFSDAGDLIVDNRSRLDQAETLLITAGEATREISGVAVENRSRLGQAEAFLVSAGETIQRTISLTQSNAEMIDRIGEKLDRLGERLDSLTAASEQHDRILDYLIRRDSNGSDQN